MSEHDVWETRFGGTDFIFGKQPNHFLASCRPLLPGSGKALAIADGEGRNGVWLAEQGLDVVSLDFSEAAQVKAASLAKERGVEIALIKADVQAWDYPADTFDVVIDIFTQFSSPAGRAEKWRGVLRTLKPNGLIIVQGYTPKQLEFGTGGPKMVENLYTRDMLQEAFGSLRDITITEEERELHEGAAHSGMSAVIGLTGRKAP
ncbi:MAG: class I SAM-dependent methyltransferase [Tardiphaga sp.]|nr:class I SAM-dependent methyltransferase [Tardiphaga sp.]